MGSLGSTSSHGASPEAHPEQMKEEAFLLCGPWRVCHTLLVTASPSCEMLGDVDLEEWKGHLQEAVS